MGNSKVFCFDGCGVGDTLIISTTLEYLLNREESGEKMQKSFMELRNMALSAVRELKTVNAFLAPTPFSDDVGFLRAGFAAQTITMLPLDEYNRLNSELRKNQKLAEIIINTKIWKNSRARYIPETWRALNGPSDSYLRLTPEHFRKVIRFAEALCSD